MLFFFRQLVYKPQTGEGSARIDPLLHGAQLSPTERTQLGMSAFQTVNAEEWKRGGYFIILRADEIVLQRRPEEDLVLATLPISLFSGPRISPEMVPGAVLDQAPEKCATKVLKEFLRTRKQKYTDNRDIIVARVQATLAAEKRSGRPKVYDPDMRSLTDFREEQGLTEVPWSKVLHHSIPPPTDPKWVSGLNAVKSKAPVLTASMSMTYLNVDSEEVRQRAEALDRFSRLKHLEEVMLYQNAPVPAGDNTLQKDQRRDVFEAHIQGSYIEGYRAFAIVNTHVPTNAVARIVRTVCAKVPKTKQGQYGNGNDTDSETEFGAIEEPACNPQDDKKKKKKRKKTEKTDKPHPVSGLCPSCKAGTGGMCIHCAASLRILELMAGPPHPGVRMWEVSTAD